MLDVIIHLRKSPTERIFLELNNIALDVQVGDLKNKIISISGLEADTNLEILHCSQKLSDDTVLQDFIDGNKKILQAYIVVPALQVNPHKLSAVEQQQIVLSFRSAMTNPHFRQTLQNVGKLDCINSLKTSVPGLASDPIALSVLRDSELLLHFADAKCVENIVDRHPALANAVAQIIADTQRTIPALDSQQFRRPQSGWFARSLGADLDDDNMESDNSPQQTLGNPSNPEAANVLTPGRLATALALVQQSLSANSVNPSTSWQTSSTTHQNSNAISSSSMPTTTNSTLTPEMFTQALLQAMTTMDRNSSGNHEENTLREQFGRYLPQMRELGITDDNLSLRALQATNGDVQAAVNLIFAGLVDD